MTRTSQAVLILYGLTVIALAYKAGSALTAYEHGEAALFYSLALVVIVAGCREIGRTHIERPKDTPLRPGPLRRLTSGWKARAAVRRESCTCDAWFKSLGREHDDWCPTNDTFWRAI